MGKIASFFTGLFVAGAGYGLQYIYTVIVDTMGQDIVTVIPLEEIVNIMSKLFMGLGLVLVTYALIGGIVSLLKGGKEEEEEEWERDRRAAIEERMERDIPPEERSERYRREPERPPERRRDEPRQPPKEPPREPREKGREPAPEHRDDRRYGRRDYRESHNRERKRKDENGYRR